MTRFAYAPKLPVALVARLYRASGRHQDLRGTNARAAFVAFVERFPAAATYQERMLAIDRVVHAVHTSGNLADRNLFEGRARRVAAALDALAAGDGAPPAGHPAG